MQSSIRTEHCQDDCWVQSQVPGVTEKVKKKNKVGRRASRMALLRSLIKEPEPHPQTEDAEDTRGLGERRYLSRLAARGDWQVGGVRKLPGGYQQMSGSGGNLRDVWEGNEPHQLAVRMQGDDWRTLLETRTQAAKPCGGGENLCFKPGGVPLVEGRTSVESMLKVEGKWNCDLAYRTASRLWESQGHLWPRQ